jgi:hypothetical protein
MWAAQEAARRENRFCSLPPASRRIPRSRFLTVAAFAVTATAVLQDAQLGHSCFTSQFLLDADRAHWPVPPNCSSGSGGDAYGVRENVFAIWRFAHIAGDRVELFRNQGVPDRGLALACIVRFCA